jgi:hypothetical protein
VLFELYRHKFKGKLRNEVLRMRVCFVSQLVVWDTMPACLTLTNGNQTHISEQNQQFPHKVYIVLTKIVIESVAEKKGETGNAMC